ncbi:MAG: hypothetical protein JSS63_03665 [Bacteroidetes bacterium]|nr:hypothetical protein [Bacteroidota bacterium]
MAFNKGRNNNKEGNSQTPFRSEQPGFKVSDKSFKRAVRISSVSVTFFLFILLVLKVKYSVSETDIQSICQITAGLSGLTLAIPLFLKDFNFTSNFWRQFYLIAITFLFATFIGLFSFLQTNATETKDVTLYLWFFFSITISINLSNFQFSKKWLKTKLNISLNPIVNFCISYLILILSLYYAQGDFLMYGVILFTIYGFYLTLSLMLSILVELFFHSTKDDDFNLRIKSAIEYLAIKYKSEALDEQGLIDKLRKEKFYDNQSIVSRTKVQELVTEMDLEIDLAKPKITIYENNYIIPRWSTEFENILMKSNPKFIFLSVLSPITEKDLFSDSYFLKEQGKSIYNKLSENSGLSVELLTDNNSLLKKYKIVKTIEDNSSPSFRDITQHYILLANINSNFIPSKDKYFNQSEYKYILKKDSLGEVYYGDYNSIKTIESLTK